MDEITMMEGSEIAEYSQTEAGLAELRTRMAGVQYDVSTIKGMAVAKADRGEVRTLRTGLEAMRKQIKAPALAQCKLIDTEAARITVELLKLEEPIDAQIKARELVLESERAARELAERKRITAIHQRIADIKGYVALALECRTAERVNGLIDRLVTLIPSGEAFEEFYEEAQLAFDQTLDRLNAVHAQKFADEAERARVKAEQAAESARLAADRAELAAAKAEQEAEIAKQRAEVNAYLAERAAYQAEADAKARAEKDATDLAAFEAAISPTPTHQNGAPMFSTTVFKDNGDPIMLDKDGKRSVFCDIDEGFPEPVKALIEAAPDVAYIPVPAVIQASMRPTDRVMVAALALHFNVADRQAFDWLYTFDFDSVSDELLDEEKNA